MTDTTQPKNELEKFKPIVADEAELQQLKNDYEKLVVTEKNLEDAAKAGLKLKNKRLEIQRMETANDDLLKKLRKDNSSRADKLVAIIEPVEKRLYAEIKNIKEEQERKRIEAENKEKERIKKHKDAIQLLHVQTAKLALSTDIAEMKANIEGLKSIAGTFEEFEAEFQEAATLYTASATQRIELLQLKAKQEEDAKKVVVEEKGEEPAKETPPEPVKEKQTTLFPTGEAKLAQTVHENIGAGNNTSNVRVDIPQEKVAYTTVSVNNAIQVPVNFTYGGYNFHLDITLGVKEREEIEKAITSIIDNIEL